MTTRLSLIDAFLAGDADTAVGLLDPDATFHSPIRSYRGVERIRPLWTAIATLLDDVRPGTLLEGDGEAAAFFEGSIDGRALDGVLKVRAQNGTPATDVTLMLRPYGSLKHAIGEMTKALGG